ncbi:TetR family transcriptional regulator [Mycolicibacterium aichiense]|nr:TetR family transcriptional regulator [Mycolicibacterium aichiense]
MNQLVREGGDSMAVTAKPATLTERRAEELRLEVAVAARDIFLADGSFSATVERICEVVGIAPRTFHRHFPVKEDVILPLFGKFGSLSIHVLAGAESGSDPVDVLVRAFGSEIPKRGQFDVDRAFMALVLSDQQYRLRWLDWGQDLAMPITEFLDNRFDLGTDSFSRELPAQLIIQACRHAYVHWVDDGDFARLQSALRIAIQMIIGSLDAKQRQP